MIISVVIPAYNEAGVIRQCLESLKSQDFTGGCEIIVVDNGSTDRTAQVAREMEVRLISCAHKGVVYARQSGAEAASGEIVVQADADTVYPLWWLSRIQKQFSRHTKAVAIAGRFIYRDPPWWAGCEYFLRVSGNILATLLSGRPYIISGANFAFYKRSFNLIGGYRHEAYSSDQFDIATRLSLVGQIVYDTKSYGSTSARSVAKPVRVIISDFLGHLATFGKYYFAGSSGETKKHAKKISPVSTGTYVKLGP